MLSKTWKLGRCHASFVESSPMSVVHACKLQSIATVIMMIETSTEKKKAFLKKSKDKKPYLNFFDRWMDESDDK